MITLLWLQRDLRIEHNPALQWAISTGQPVSAIYIHSPEDDRQWTEGGASRWWLHHSLQQLAKDLEAHNIRLDFFRGRSADIIQDLVKHHDINQLVWTRRVEPYRRQCEESILEIAEAGGVHARRFSHGLLTTPDDFVTQAKQTPYRVFTPFYKKLRSELQLSNTDFKLLKTAKAAAPESGPVLRNSLSLDALQLLDKHPWHHKLHHHWRVGEAAAQRKLEQFIAQSLHNYPVDRDYPAIEGTSGLSPHLHFGEISAQQVLMALLPLINHGKGRIVQAAEAFLRQLIWREFAAYILWHFPETVEHPMDKRYQYSFWSDDIESLERWKRGETGIDIIDAGMKQLWETGSLHNRVRMLVASLLTKNLGIHWLQGARWFWDTLVDADLANNTMGWQWVAGCGVDAAPYFRIFNPLTQAQKFDPQQSYCQRWLEPADVHEPVVDLKASRQQALDRYRETIRQV